MFIKSKQISCHIHIQNHFYRQTVIIMIIIICLIKSNLVLTDNTKLYEYMIYHTSLISCQVLSLFADVVHRIHCVLFNYVAIFHVVRLSIELFHSFQLILIKTIKMVSIVKAEEYFYGKCFTLMEIH